MPSSISWTISRAITPGVVRVDPWPESNHSTFSMRGVPSLAFSAVGIRHLAHTPADSIEQVSPAKVSEVIAHGGGDRERVGRETPRLEPAKGMSRDELRIYRRQPG